MGSWRGPCPEAEAPARYSKLSATLPFPGGGACFTPAGRGGGGQAGGGCHTGGCRCRWRRWQGCHCSRPSVTPRARISCDSRGETASFSTTCPEPVGPVPVPLRTGVAADVGMNQLGRAAAVGSVGRRQPRRLGRPGVSRPSAGSELRLCCPTVSACCLPRGTSTNVPLRCLAGLLLLLSRL